MVSDKFYLTIMDNDRFLFWAIYRGLYHYLGLAMNVEYRRVKGEWKSNPRNKIWRCAICDLNINRKSERTIDHIIPKNLCYELGLPQLIIDERNFRAAHQLCNARRGELTVEDLSPNVLAKLKEIGYV